jgi:hypothetical protein
MVFSSGVTAEIMGLADAIRVASGFADPARNFSVGESGGEDC